MTNPERVKVFLESFGTKKIETDSLTGLFPEFEKQFPNVDYNPSAFSQVLMKMEQAGDIKLERKPMFEGAKKVRVVGIELIRGFNSHELIEQAGNKAKEQIERSEPLDISSAETPEEEHTSSEVTITQPDPKTSFTRPEFPITVAYLQKKLAVENALEQLLNAGVPMEEVDRVRNIVSADPQAEEAVKLLDLCEQAFMQLNSVRHQRDLAEINAEVYHQQMEYWRSKLPEATRKQLLDAAPKRNLIESAWNAAHKVKPNSEPPRQNERPNV
jgi:hypothetical protein